ncbi:MAG: integrase family protein [Alphaproteobacteria bacterium]
MVRRKTLTDKMVADLKAKATRYMVPDPECRGHYVRVAASGAKSYCAVARDPGGKQIWATIGAVEHHTIDEAREQATDAIKRVKKGLPPFEAPTAKPASLKEVAEDYMKRHTGEREGDDGSKMYRLRSGGEVRRILDKYVYPEWAERDFAGIRRGDVTALLDKVEDENGPRQADYVLAIVRGIMNWRASRTDDYVSPITRGMRRTDPKSRKRARILDDDEIRLFWRLAENSGSFGAIMRLALLTAQRREKIATMKWEDITTNGEWRIATEEREKGTAGTLLLPDAASAIIQAQVQIADNPYVFAGRGAGHFQGYSPCKRAFDKRILETLREAAAKRGDDPETIQAPPTWVIHDLRRTARSLMARAGVRPDIAERVMGHAIAGVEGVYDRHSYYDEKADALKKLAGLLDQIVKPLVVNAVELPRAEVSDGRA